MKTIILPLLTACAISPVGQADLPAAKTGATAISAAAPADDSCDYIEMDDATNDDDAVPGAIEPTGLSVPGTVTLCGVINNGHYNVTYDTVDVDNYEITVDDGSDMADLGVIATIPGETILSQGGEISITISDSSGNPVTGGFVAADIAGFRTFAPISPGSYQLNVSAFGTGSDSPTSFPYVLTIVGDY
jgi:hypothetical protein